MRGLRSIRLGLITIAMLVSVALAFDEDSHRVESLAAKLRCDCGCGDVLAECSHTKCESRGKLKLELADAVREGQTDEQILAGMSTRHGAAILLTPAFKGSNTLLWIVPIALGFLGLAFVLFGRLRSKQQPTDDAH